MALSTRSLNVRRRAEYASLDPAELERVRAQRRERDRRYRAARAARAAAPTPETLELPPRRLNLRQRKRLAQRQQRDVIRQQVHDLFGLDYEALKKASRKAKVPLDKAYQRLAAYHSEQSAATRPISECMKYQADRGNRLAKVATFDVQKTGQRIEGNDAMLSQFVQFFTNKTAGVTWPAHVDIDFRLQSQSYPEVTDKFIDFLKTGKTQKPNFDAYTDLTNFNASVRPFTAKFLRDKGVVEYPVEQRLLSLSDTVAKLQSILNERRLIGEFYNSNEYIMECSRNELEANIFEHVTHIRIRVTDVRYTASDRIRGKHETDILRIYRPNNAPEGLCYAQALHEQLAPHLAKFGKMSLEQFAAFVGISKETGFEPSPQNVRQLEVLLKTPIHQFDVAGNMTYMGSEDVKATKSRPSIYIGFVNGHAHSWDDPNVAKSNAMKTSSLFRCVHGGLKLQGSVSEFFAKYSHLLPNWRAVLEQMCLDLDLNVTVFSPKCEKFFCYGHGRRELFLIKQVDDQYSKHCQREWLRVIAEDAVSRTETLCKKKFNHKLLIDINRSDKTDFSMKDVFVLDLETCSITGGIFQSYSAGVQHLEDGEITYKEFNAQTREDLDRVAFDALEYCQSVHTAKYKKDKRYKENMIKKCVEVLTGRRFAKARPKFLDRLELDGYNKSIGVAIEVQGVQHREFVPHFHGTIENFRKQQDIDARKVQLCKDNGVNLVAIGTDVVTTPEETFEAIREALKNNGVPMVTHEVTHEFVDFTEVPGESFVYTYNGSRFDNLFFLRELFMRDPKHPVRNLIESGGRIVMFTWRNLKFLDLCLLTMCPLRVVANSAGVQEQKGYFPYKFLQSVSSYDELFERLNGTYKVHQLDPYFDKMSDLTDKDELQKMRDCETADRRIKRISKVHKWVTENAEVDYNVRSENSKYLRGDVSVTWKVLEKIGLQTQEEYGINIAETPTVGSLALAILRKYLPKAIPKIVNPKVFQAFKRANRGGFCGVLDYFEFSVADHQGWTISGFDVTSLYPSSTRATPITQPWFHDFPCPPMSVETPIGRFQDPKTGEWREKQGNPVTVLGDWEELDEPVVVDREMRKKLEKMWGVFRVQYDDRKLKYPLMLVNAECKHGKSLTFIRKGEDEFATPTILHAFDKGVSLKILSGHFVRQSFNPFTGYMDHFADKKNSADIRREELKEAKQKDSDEYRKCEYDRFFAKLLLNSLLGRLNMKVDRNQTVYTKSPIDVLNILGNEMFFQQVSYKYAEETGVYTVKYNEQDNARELVDYPVAPYLSAYMLAYAKIAMTEAIQFLAEYPEDQCKMLYTDTDSIYFASGPEVRQAFIDKFAFQKGLGMMADEDKDGVQCDYFCSIGPKKYIKSKGNVTEFRANGIRASENVELDLKKTFREILHEHKKHKFRDWKMVKQRDGQFQIKHTEEARQATEHTEEVEESTKLVRFICNKGAFDARECRIKFFDTQEEWAKNVETQYRIRARA